MFGGQISGLGCLDLAANSDFDEPSFSQFTIPSVTPKLSHDYKLSWTK